MKILEIWKKKYFIHTLIFISLFVSSCDNQDTALAPYNGSPQMSNVVIEEGSFRPKITWVGGYASVIGVNKGNKAILDSTLIYLVKVVGNNLKYPVRFGDIPIGGVSLLNEFNGNEVDSLSEDRMYTYWVMKEDMWNKISQKKNTQFLPNNNLASGEFLSTADSSIELSSYSFTVKSQFIDVFVNIKDLKFFGRLGNISVLQPIDARPPLVNWIIRQTGLTDTAISAIGLVEGQQFDEKFVIWDLWSVQNTDAGKIYGKKNVITAPLRLGDSFTETISFKDYPAEGILRNKDYYIWFANENWDGKTRSRVTNYYAYATFRTW